MLESLADSLAIAARQLPVQLVSRGEIRRLARLAKRLAPVHCAGFEVRLSNGARHVDLQQRITPRDSEPARLVTHLRQAGLANRPGWRRIASFMQAWPVRSELGAVVECWLEYEPEAERSAPPSLFLSIDRRLGAIRGASACSSVLARCLSAPALREARSALRLVARRLPEGAKICDLGLMARWPASLRVNVGGLNAAGIEQLLSALGWEAPQLERIALLAREIEPTARHLKLALDWHGGWLRRAGIEIVPGGDPELPIAKEELGRWRQLLAVLRTRRLCDARRAAALLAWPGEESPAECPLDWPASLILESLVRGVDAFSMIGRRLSHVKIDFPPGEPPLAKAYFGFGRLWEGAPPRRGGRGSTRTLAAAIAASASFLLDARDSGGTWRDFEAIREGSDEWVCAYVAAALARRGGTAARHAARTAWWRLARLRTEAGWGYNARIPVDADSTSWVLRLAASLGKGRVPALKETYALVRAHRDPAGGVSSFLPDALGASPGQVPVELVGWCMAHAEVTAAAGALHGFAGSSARWLARAQRPEGSWRSYWYDEDAFASAFAAEHLATRRDPVSRRALARAARWAAARVAADGSVPAAGLAGGSPFAAACCLRILLSARLAQDSGRAVERIAMWLLAEQLPNGGWRGSAPLRETRPADSDPQSFGERQGFAWDERSLFTTATVLEALGALAERRRPAARRRSGAGASASRA